MAIDRPTGPATLKACRSGLRDDFDALVRNAAMAGWSTAMTAAALAEMARELGDRARVYQNFGLMSERDSE